LLRLRLLLLLRLLLRLLQWLLLRLLLLQTTGMVLLLLQLGARHPIQHRRLKVAGPPAATSDGLPSIGGAQAAWNARCNSVRAIPPAAVLILPWRKRRSGIPELAVIAARWLSCGGAQRRRRVRRGTPPPEDQGGAVRGK